MVEPDNYSSKSLLEMPTTRKEILQVQSGGYVQVGGVGGGGGGGVGGGGGGGPPHPGNLKFVRNFSASLNAFRGAQPGAQRGTKRPLNGKKRSRKTRKYRKNRNSRTRKH
jgi:hypothetical protein